MSEFICDLDELIPLFSTKKVKVTNHLKKNYKENIHYIIKNDENKNKHGGHNKKRYLLTEKVFQLLKNSFNFRNRYIANVSENIEYVNPIAMCIENQTIGFIQNAFSHLESKRQFTIGKYRVDLYFPKYKLVIECDENNHEDRNIIQEKIRQEYIVAIMKNRIIRYNPNEKTFDLSNVIQQIIQAIYI
jgi:hypothetical protein